MPMTTQETLDAARQATLDEADAIRREFFCENPEVMQERLLSAQLAVLRRIEFGLFELLDIKRNEIQR